MAGAPTPSAGPGGPPSPPVLRQLSPPDVGPTAVKAYRRYDSRTQPGERRIAGTRKPEGRMTAHAASDTDPGRSLSAVPSRRPGPL